ncbi:class I SAM-dependent methyltransferase [Rhizobium ruizarguesonis]|uniref:Uncharacterized protein n=1 Tax=Rhizobium ruizarguesonis TaxID=2081791 RepID=A0AAE8U0Q0_9HYPH|nr:hypothetical protein [Rhizobium ruizarguesonis]TAV04260.1 hypothetical protein ELI39_02625 [Rhizobium ruizarguesonis]TBA79201.1 hypothetical protein ELH56_02535 [Rhizobium ruizarguesonis]TBA83980.1 hypothetical protein ELH53_02540 [Rhizobium ruizarguesonis]TBB10105.1 hypothetical protein ELH50_02785 [Rhizobium ruizarguesonis]TBB20785.1 hypothetical protein ELH51_02535 [Rhizobium ruizarguesonis]
MGVIDVIGNALSDYANREKTYWSWDDACRAAKSDYSDALLTDFRIARSKGILGEEEGIFIPSPVISEAMEGEAAHFVDFGGAVGEMCSVIQKRFPSWSFTVVETTAMARAAASVRPSVSFADKLPDEITVLHTSGTLQYLKDAEGVWDGALQRTRRYACLVRNAFESKIQYRVQRSRLFDNGGGPIPPGFHDMEIRYPQRTLSERKMVRIAEKNGFELVRRINQNSGVVSSVKGMYGADLLFKRVR